MSQKRQREWDAAIPIVYGPQVDKKEIKKPQQVFNNNALMSTK